MAEMVAGLGHRWAPPLVNSVPVDTAAGVRSREVRYTYSLGDEHPVELIEQVDATAYEALPGGRRIHHLGYAVEDLEASSKRLVAAGCELHLWGSDGEGRPRRAAFHSSPLMPGLWIELLDREVVDQISAWLAR